MSKTKIIILVHVVLALAIMAVFLPALKTDDSGYKTKTAGVVPAQETVVEAVTPAPVVVEEPVVVVEEKIEDVVPVVEATVAEVTAVTETAVTELEATVEPTVSDAVSTVEVATASVQQTATATMSDVTSASTTTVASVQEVAEPSTPAAEAQIHVVTPQGLKYAPLVVKIALGDTVAWENMSSHDTQALEGLIPEGTKVWHSSMGENYEHTFTQEGIYIYKCTPHFGAGMGGVIIVGNPVNLEAIKAAKETSKGAAKRLVKKAIKAAEAA